MFTMLIWKKLGNYISLFLSKEVLSNSGIFEEFVVDILHYRNGFWKKRIPLIKCCILINISIIIIVQIQIQADSLVSDTNGFINFTLLALATRGERQKSEKPMLITLRCLPLRVAHLVVFKISINLGRSRRQKYNLIWSEKFNCVLQR